MVVVTKEGNGGDDSHSTHTHRVRYECARERQQISEVNSKI